MLKTTSTLLFSAALFSTTAHAVIQDQQWGNWFGNISAMEFEINTRAIKGIDGDVKLNRALWVMAENMLQLAS